MLDMQSEDYPEAAPGAPRKSRERTIAPSAAIEEDWHSDGEAFLPSSPTSQRGPADDGNLQVLADLLEGMHVSKWSYFWGIQG